MGCPVKLMGLPLIYDNLSLCEFNLKGLIVTINYALSRLGFTLSIPRFDIKNVIINFNKRVIIDHLIFIYLKSDLDER